MLETKRDIQLPFTTSHAFIIGIDHYKHLNHLTTAVKDAEVLAEQLTTSHDYQVHGPLLNASKADLLNLLKKDMPQIVGPEDRVLFYFAGHGIALNSDDDPKGYLIPVDAKPGNTNTLLAMDVLHQAFTSLPCKHGLLIMDCCFAGAFKWSTNFRDIIFDLPAIIYEERFYQYARDPAWQVITSSASDQKAVDILSNHTLGLRNGSSAEHSPFALALIEGLQGAADTIPKDQEDGVITATELYTYLRDRVEDETTLHGKRQSPSLFSLSRHGRGQYIFINPRHPLNLPPIPDRNPFMGLKSYTEKDHLLFYGRDRVITDLEELTTHTTLVVVSGASGTGKSSVIKAGLLPLLRKKGWQISPIVRPGKQPILSLNTAIFNLDSQLNSKSHSVLVIDQYEELITQCLKPDERYAFEKQLAEWLKTYPKLHIIISIRSDFETQFAEATLARWWQQGHYLVPAFSQDELREVIIKPAVQEVLYFEPDSLVGKLVDAVNQAPGALPLLSFTLSELYYAYINSGRTNRALTLDDYEKLGGVIGALRNRANAIYNGLNVENKRSMRKLMLRMVALKEGGLISKRVLEKDLVLRDKLETPHIAAIARKLVDARLVSSGIDKQGNKYYEPAHDALVSSWAQLWKWVRDIGEDTLLLVDKLNQAVTEYESIKTKDYLWTSHPRIEELSDHLTSRHHFFNEREVDFINKSIRTKRRLQNRRRFQRTTAFLILFSISIVALWQRSVAKAEAQRANEEKINALSSTWAAQSRQISPTDPTIALNLAYLAYHTRPSNESISAFRAVNSDLNTDFYKNYFDAQDYMFDVYDISYSSDGKHIVSCGNDRRIKVWTNEGELYQQFQPDSLGTSCVVFSKDGQRVLSASWSGKIFISTIEGQELQSFQAHKGYTSSVSFSPDENFILSGGDDGMAKLWNLNGQLIKTYPCKEIVNVVAFSPDGQQLVTGSHDYTVRLWSLEGQLTRVFRGHTATVYSVAFSPDGTKILSGSQDGTAKLWQKNGRLITTVERSRHSQDDVAFSPNGDVFAATAKDGAAKIWNLEGQLQKTFKGHEKAALTTTFSPDGAWIATGGLNGKINISSTDKRWKNKYEKAGNLAVFSPSGTTFVSNGTETRALLWSIDGELIQEYTGHNKKILSVAVSSDGEYILTGSADHTAKLWQLDGHLKTTYEGHQEGIQSVAISSDGSLVLTGSSDQTAKLWTLDGALIQTFKGHEDAIKDVAISPDNQKILTASEDRTIRLWSLNGQVIGSIKAPQEGNFGTTVAFSPPTVSEIKILAGFYSEFALYDYNLHPIRKFNAWTPVSHASFSANSSYIISTNADGGGKTQIWDIEGRELMWIPGYAESASFSPNNKYILTGSGSGTQYLWWNLIDSWDKRIYQLNDEERKQYQIPDDLKY